MKKFLLLYHGGSMPEGEAAQAQVMKAWEGWFGKLGKSLVDGGNPTGASKTIAANGSVSSGAANGASGYSVISADSLDAAVALAKGCPVLGGGASIEVCEIVEVM
jgi:hypothetical protein